MTVAAVVGEGQADHVVQIGDCREAQPEGVASNGPAGRCWQALFGQYDYALVNNRPDAAPLSGAAPRRGKTLMAIPYAVARSDGMLVCINVSGLADVLSER